MVLLILIGFGIISPRKISGTCNYSSSSQYDVSLYLFAPPKSLLNENGPKQKNSLEIRSLLTRVTRAYLSNGIWGVPHFENNKRYRMSCIIHKNYNSSGFRNSGAVSHSSAFFFVAKHRTRIRMSESRSKKMTLPSTRCQSRWVLSQFPKPASACNHKPHGQGLLWNWKQQMGPCWTSSSPAGSPHVQE